MSMEAERKTPRQRAEELSREMRCNCDLDKWEPERRTGHSWVCRIHKAVVEEERKGLI